MTPPRLDSKNHRIQGLFRLLEAGFSYLRFVRDTPTRRLSPEALEFVAHAQCCVESLAQKTPLTEEERVRVQQQLDELKAAIDAVR